MTHRRVPIRLWCEGTHSNRLQRIAKYLPAKARNIPDSLRHTIADRHRFRRCIPRLTRHSMDSSRQEISSSRASLSSPDPRCRFSNCTEDRFEQDDSRRVPPVSLPMPEVYRPARARSRAASASRPHGAHLVGTIPHELDHLAWTCRRRHRCRRSDGNESEGDAPHCPHADDGCCTHGARGDCRDFRLPRVSREKRLTRGGCQPVTRRDNRRFAAHAHVVR